MIIENRSTEIGDVISIVTDTPIIGLLSLSGFADVVTGETGTRLFKKEFRYSVDGINYSDWTPLTIPNINDVTVLSNDTFFIEYRYSRIGSDSSGELSFENNTLTGEFVPQSVGPAFDNSIFAQFFDGYNDLDVLRWAINVTEKLYKHGIVPNYILRGNNQSNSQDRDYVDFWRSIATLFALIVMYARKFEDFASNQALLEEYLREKNLFFANSTLLEDLIYLTNNYFDEIRQRGTIQITKKKGELLDESISISTSLSLSSPESEEIKPVDGELLRLIDFNASQCDEFLFNLVVKNKLGWNVGNSSPLHRGMSNQLNVNKAYEDSIGINSKTKYPLTGPENISIISDGGINVMRILGKNGEVGIGGGTNFDKAITVHHNLDYEITFLIEKPQSGGNIVFGVYGLDQDNLALDLKKITDGTPSNTFFTVSSLNKNNKYYFVRGIIYASSKDNTKAAHTLNIGFGTNLQFADIRTCKIIPKVILSNSTNTGEIRIKDFKVKPLTTPWSTGFIQTNNFIEIWMKNNNASLTNDKLENFIRRYLIPYNTTFKNIYIS